ncbi:hypothetical protein ABT124_48000 [Streptomyces sp. NPDC001982]|uniref:hypothetical protein n=1 Tax=Streptomyces sp. NPDC001982 TaxID=3154405 RepID=UPI003330E425
MSDTHRRQRAVTAAAARKRLLQARYLGWASGTKSGGTGVIGPALESVVHASLVQVAPHGYRLVRPEGGGDISQLLGAPVPIGPLDNAALLTVLDHQTFRPTGTYWTLIEAKNLRLCIYPIHPELHQLLAKSASLQVANPGVSFVPVLVCRRAHYLTFRMNPSR